MNKFTVTEITGAIKNLIEGTFNDVVTVSGEITGCSISPRGHVYFMLKDSNAKIRVAMFRRASVGAYTPKNGDSVDVTGELKIYDADGVYQLIARKIEYDSVGIFWQKFEATKRKLEAEGLFDEARKKKVPILPEKVAIITSATGAAITDFIAASQKNGGKFLIDLWSVPVQGKEAVLPIIDALNKAGKLTNVYDALVLMRGGGSLEDLAVFSDESVARAVAATDVPCISAVGHERDFSICDFTADLRVATPTAAAVRLSEGYAVREKELAVYIGKLSTLLENKTNTLNQQMDFLLHRLNSASPLEKLSEYKDKLNVKEKEIIAAISKKLNLLTQKLDFFGRRLSSSSPKIKLFEMKKKVGSKEKELGFLVNKKLELLQHRLNFLGRRLNSFSPRLKLIELKRKVSVKEKELGLLVDKKFGFLNQKLNFLGRRLNSSSPKVKITLLKNRVEKKERELCSIMEKNILQVSRKLELCDTNIRKFNPSMRVERIKNKTNLSLEKLKSIITYALNENKQRLELLNARLDGVSPNKALERGFALVSVNKKLVRKAKDINLEDDVEIRFNDGYINSFVTGRKIAEDGNGEDPDN